MKFLIAAATLLALVVPAHAASEEAWFLTLNVWFCNVRTCDFGGPPHRVFVENETFDTEKKCLAEGYHLAQDPLRLVAKYELGTDTITGIIPRCAHVWPTNQPSQFPEMVRDRPR